MRKLFPVLGLLALAACQSKTAKQPADSIQTIQTTTDALGAKGVSSQFYKQFKGTLAGQPVTMQLIRSRDNSFSGYYVYDNIGEPIRLFSEQDTTGYLVLLEGDAGSEGQKKLKGKLDNGVYSGDWTDGTRTFPFSLKEDNKGTIDMQLIVVEDSGRIREGDMESPSATSYVQVLWPVGGAPEQTLQLIRDSITRLEKQQFKDGESYAKSQAASFVSSSLSELRQVDSVELRASAAFNQWSSQQSMEVVWNKYPHLVLEESYYEYTGGAHGNGGSIFTFFDLARNKALLPADVFKPGYEPVLSKALEKAVRKQYNLKPEEALDAVLFDKTIKPNNNFYMTDKYVVFSYTPYEIAAYAAGQISLAVPLSEVKSVLK